jgi:DNA-binding MarR family transcriptional regulator
LKKVNTTTRPELLDDGSDFRFRALIYDFLAFNNRLGEIRNGLGTLIDLPGTQYSTLIAIAMLEERTSPGVSDVAEYLHVSGTFVTLEVKKLIARGLITKSPSNIDRRRVSLAATPKGMELLRELRRLQAPINDTMFANISRDDFETLSRVLPLLNAQAEEALIDLQYQLSKSQSSSKKTQQSPAS